MQLKFFVNDMRKNFVVISEILVILAKICMESFDDELRVEIETSSGETKCKTQMS